MSEDFVYIDRGKNDSVSTGVLVKAARNEPTAWFRLMRRFRPLVKSLCHREGVRHPDASDVCQEVFGAVARNLPRFRAQKSLAAFNAWLQRVTINKVRDFRRRKKNPAAAIGGDVNYGELLRLFDAMSLEECEFDHCASDRTTAPLVARQGEQPTLFSLSDFDPQTREKLEAIVRVRSCLPPGHWVAYTRMVCDRVPVTQLTHEVGATPGSLYRLKAQIAKLIRDEWSRSA